MSLRFGAAALGLLLLQSPALGSDPNQRFDPLRAEARLNEELSRLTTIRSLFSTGRLTDVVRAGGAAGDPVATSPMATGIEPQGLAGPIAELVAAVDGAGVLVRSALPGDRQGGRALRDAALKALGRWSFSDRRGPAPSSQVLDLSAFDRAAVTLADAADRALPALIASAEAPSHPSEAIGCDVLDRPPTLCVGGTGDNVYTADYQLLIELGGQDLHANAAGAADTYGNGFSAAMAIDLGGNDRYATSVPTAGNAAVVQGSGLFGVGMLIDVAGNDSYLASVEKANTFANGQGLGILGAGLLADLGGDDRYELASTAPQWALALGQGAGVGGLGILLDAEGDDGYRLESRPTPVVESGVVDDGTSIAAGIGFGEWAEFILMNLIHVRARLLTGVLADGGGTDTVVIVAGGSARDASDRRPVRTNRMTGAYGMGWAFENANGIALFGDGPTQARVRASTSTPAMPVAASGFGYSGSGSGEAIFSDGGGPDSYLLEAESRVISTTQSCCPDQPTAARAGEAEVLGFGHGSGGGTGLMHDAGGDDIYRAFGSSVAVARASVSTQGEGGLTAVAESSDVAMATHGYAFEFGQGMLVDEHGDDRYEQIATSSADAATAGEEADPAGQATASTGVASVVGLAAARMLAFAFLRDLGGSDVYETRSSTEAVADPLTSAFFEPANADVLASVDLGAAALFADTDGIAVDSVVTIPPSPACVGTRGQAAWADCNGAGFGSLT